VTDGERNGSAGPREARKERKERKMSQLAIHGGKPLRTKPWPEWPVFGKEERRELLDVFESGKWWYGDKVREFERKFAAFQDAAFGITSTSGTTGLEAALVGLGIQPGDEVIVPPYTFVATASSVLRVGGRPVFADVDLDTFNIDPQAVEEAITARTRAVVPVHFGGLPCDMDRLTALAKEHGLRILEDACHSWGAKWRGKGTGALGDCGVFSFQMSKNITAGEGGIVLTDDEELADTVRSFTNVGRGKDKPWYEHYLLGSNLRMTELQAAILLGQLTRLDEQTAKREENGAFLSEKLQELPGLHVQPPEPRATRRAYHLYLIRLVEEEAGIGRGRFLEAVQAEGIVASGGYPHPLYKNPVFEDQPGGNFICPNAEALCRQAISIPHRILLAEKKDMQDIVRAAEKVLENREELR
jgi:dTDP-4-amino-4,6-dideoxygalactose transaminase